LVVRAEVEAGRQLAHLLDEQVTLDEVARGVDAGQALECVGVEVDTIGQPVGPVVRRVQR
jgi:hypothetical protein